MFPVTDSLEQRRAKIECFLVNGHATIALVLAAADFERTLRRAVIALAKEPTADVRAALESPKYNSFGKYGRAWRDFVEPAQKIPFEQVVPDFGKLKSAFQLRNELVHGAHGTTGMKYAAQRIGVILAATQNAHDIATERQVDLTAKIKVRPRPRKAGHP